MMARHAMKVDRLEGGVGEQVGRLGHLLEVGPRAVASGR